MTRSANAIVLWALSLTVGIWIPSCSNLSEKSECEKHITEEIRIGVPLETAKTVLERCGFKTEIDRTNSTLYGDKEQVVWLSRGHRLL